MTAVISIVTPFYNTGLLFNETIASVLGQTLQLWEWIIVDDCSKDPESTSLLARLEGTDRRIRIERLPENVGPGAARNLGVGLAKADYVFQLDADDTIVPTALEVLLWFTTTRPKCMFAKGFEEGFGSQSYVWKRGFDDGHGFLKRNCVQTNSLVRKEVFRATGGYDASMREGFEDWDFWLKCADKGLWGRTVPLLLHGYRRRDNHADRWPAFGDESKVRDFGRILNRKYQGLTKQSFATLKDGVRDQRGAPTWEDPFAAAPHEPYNRSILILMPHFEIGGADKFNLDLVSTFKNSGYRLTLVATGWESSHPWEGAFRDLIDDVFILDSFLKIEDWPRFLGYLIVSRKIAVMFNTHSESGYDLAAAILLRFPKLLSVDFLHIVELRWMNGGYPRMSLAARSSLDLTFVSSNFLRSWMVAQGADPASVVTAYTGVDSSYWSKAAIGSEGGRTFKSGIDSDQFVVSFVGRLHEQKRLPMVLEIVEALFASNCELTFLIAGDGPELSSVLRFVRRHGPSKVKWLGRMETPAVRELLSVTDVLLLPSENEGVSIALYEAMSMEVVVVTADVGGQKEVLTPNEGFLVRNGVGEMSAYVSCVKWLRANPNALATMKAAARVRVMKFTLEGMKSTVAAALEAQTPHRSISATGDGNFLLAELRAAVIHIQARRDAYDVWNQKFCGVKPRVWLSKMVSRLRSMVRVLNRSRG